MAELTQSIDIRDKETVTGTSQGSNIRSTWNPGDNYARELEIQKARQEAYDAEQQRVEDEKPLNLRFAALEREVLNLKKQVKELTNAQSK